MDVLDFFFHLRNCVFFSKEMLLNVEPFNKKDFEYPQHYLVQLFLLILSNFKYSQKYDCRL